MSGENGDKSQRQTSEEIEHHIEVILFFHQSCSLVHKGREGSESSAESRGEQQFGRWRHPSPFQFNPERNPMMRHPATFTAIVPNGKAITVQDCTIFDTQYLMPPPKKLPMLTINTSFISLYNICIIIWCKSTGFISTDKNIFGKKIILFLIFPSILSFKG